MTTITASSQTTSPYPTATGNKHAKQSSPGEKAETSIVDQFLAYQRLTPQQKIRQAILEKLGLTEDDLKRMPPEVRNKVEDDIKLEIEKQAKSNLAQKGILVDITV